MSKFLTRSVFVVIAILIAAFVFGPGILERSMNRVQTHAPYEISKAAADLHADMIVGDWHADSALWNRDLGDESSYGQVDLPRLQKGNVALQMFTTVTKSPAGQNYEKNPTDARDNITSLAIIQRWPMATWSSLAERALFQADKIHQLAEQHPDDFMLITSQSELGEFINRRIQNKTLVGGLLGTEGSHALDGELANIERLYKRGFRMMSLQHFFDNKLGGSLHGESQAGLTEFGMQAIAEMERLNIIIDVAHSSEQVVRDVLQATNRPLVVSHTGFKGYCNSPRNISDALMREIASRGGLIAVGYWEGAICGTHPKMIAEAINYGIQLVGARHVALGSDFDGSVTTALDTSELAAITKALLGLGVQPEEIRAVMGGNMLLFLADNLPQ